MKMAAGWLLLVCAVVVLRSARAQDPYDQLPDHYRKGVDLALENLGAHAGVQHHYRFLRSLEKSDSEVDPAFEASVTFTGLTSVASGGNLSSCLIYSLNAVGGFFLCSASSRSEFWKIRSCAFSTDPQTGCAFVLVKRLNFDSELITASGENFANAAVYFCTYKQFDLLIGAFRVQSPTTEAGFAMKYLYHHFLLKPTTCAKGAAASSPQRCPFRNDRPMMDCAVCYKMSGNQIELIPKPYVHCTQRPRLTQEMRTTRTQHCRKMNYNSGAPRMMAVSNGKH